MRNTARKKADTEIYDLPVFKQVECCYCGEEFRSQLQVKKYPRKDSPIVVCRIDCGKACQVLNGEGRPKYRKISGDNGKKD